MIQNSPRQSARGLDFSQDLAKKGWYHSFEFPDGTAIDGYMPLHVQKERYARYPIPGDLKGKRVAMDDYDGHTGLNVWLYLHKNGLEEGRDVELVTDPVKGPERAKGVMEGKYDATFIRAVDRLRALKFGAKVVEVPPMAMIEGVTLTTTTQYVKTHEDEARSLVMAMIDGTHFFKTKKTDTLAILKKHCSQLLKMQSDEEWDCFYENQVASLEAKPYPSLEAVQNVFALAVKRDPEIKGFNPLTLWDLHYVKEIDDSGYIRNLYAQ